MRAALFNLDETLLDRSGSLHDFVSWQANDMLRTSVNHADKFIERFIMLDNKGMLWKDKVYASLIEEFNITDWSVDELLHVYWLTFCAFCKPREGAAAAIKAFRAKGFKVGLVTNGKTPFQERNFKALGLSEYVDCVVVSDAVKLRKPDSAIYEFACNRLNADISTSVFIGDNPVADMQGAKNAGMGTIYVPVNREHAPCEHADVTFAVLSDIAQYVNNKLCAQV